MKLIQVKKILGGTGTYITHYVNPNHIISLYVWSGETVLLLSNGDKLFCSDTLEDVINQLKE
jgi:uncharacterized protein YlzI (FlbEa/FlbD family)